MSMKMKGYRIHLAHMKCTVHCGIRSDEDLNRLENFGESSKECIFKQNSSWASTNLKLIVFFNYLIYFDDT